MKRTTKKTSRKAQLRVVQRDDHSALLAHFAQCPELFAPMLSLIESGKQSIAAVMNQAGRALVELLLQLSASSIAGEKSPGRHSGEVLWHGSQADKCVCSSGGSRCKSPDFARAVVAGVRWPYRSMSSCRRTADWLGA